MQSQMVAWCPRFHYHCRIRGSRTGQPTASIGQPSGFSGRRSRGHGLPAGNGSVTALRIPCWPSKTVPWTRLHQTIIDLGCCQRSSPRNVRAHIAQQNEKDIIQPTWSKHDMQFAAMPNHPLLQVVGESSCAHPVVEAEARSHTPAKAG